jgi:citryl-CoA lyase
MPEPQIHDHKLTDLIDRMNFPQAIYYLWTGRMPSEAQEKLFQACLVAVIDHGPDALSTKTARMAASGGAEMHAALAAGALAASKHHGTLPIRNASKMITEAIKKNVSAKDLVAEYLQEKKRMPGFGHRVYETDPRTQALLRKAESLGLKSREVDYALEVEQELQEQKGKKLCLNVDGMIASLLPSLELDPEIAQSMFLIGRLPGMAYHISTQKKEKPASMREKKKLVF